MGKIKVKKIPCKYGEKCYRRNPKHQEEFTHPDDDENRDDNPPPAKKKKIEDFFGAASKKKESKTGDGPGTSKESKDSDEEDKPASPEADQSKSPEKETPPQSDSEEEEAAPSSPADVKDNIKAKFLVEMPQDFFDFLEFAKSVNSKNPTEAFKNQLGLTLVGPYDVLAGKCRSKNSAGKRPCYLRHWRYYYDPPEFMTVLAGDPKTQFHIGYFRDDPKCLPVFVASNAAKENCTISPRGENIFAGVSWLIEDTIKKDKSKKDKLQKLKTDLAKFAKTKDYSLEQKTKTMKAREKKVVCKTFHGAGLVVPVDDQGIGYREVPETPGDLKKMFKKIVDAKNEDDRNKAFDPLMEIIMLVQFANDECDYGEGLELALDLFSYGGEVFHSNILTMMPLAYQLLNKEEYAKIIEAHLKDRRHSADLSQIA